MYAQTRMLSQHAPIEPVKNCMGVLGWFNGVGRIRLGILSMPNNLCMPFYFKIRSVKENPIPYMV